MNDTRSQLMDVLDRFRRGHYNFKDSIDEIEKIYINKIRRLAYLRG